MCLNAPLAAAYPTCRYCVQGFSPREAGCLESLSPWVKLLPCSEDEGLAALLDRAASCTAQHLSLTVSAQLRQPAVCESAAAAPQTHSVSSAETKAAGQTVPVQFSIQQTLTVVSDFNFARPWPKVRPMQWTAGPLSNMTSSVRRCRHCSVSQLYLPVLVELALQNEPFLREQHPSTPLDQEVAAEVPLTLASGMHKDALAFRLQLTAGQPHGCLLVASRSRRRQQPEAGHVACT